MSNRVEDFASWRPWLSIVLFVLVALVCWYGIRFWVLSVRHSRTQQLHVDTITHSPGAGDYTSLDYTALGHTRSGPGADILTAVGLTFAVIGGMLIFFRITDYLASRSEIFGDSWHYALAIPLFVSGTIMAARGIVAYRRGRSQKPTIEKYRQFVSDNNFQYIQSNGNKIGIADGFYKIDSNKLPPSYVVTRKTTGIYQEREFAFLGIYANSFSRRKVPFYGVVYRSQPNVAYREVAERISEADQEGQVIDLVVDRQGVGVVFAFFPPIDRAGVMKLFRYLDAIDAASREVYTKSELPKR